MHFEAVFHGLYDSDPVVRMRTGDVIEKVTRDVHELLIHHTKEIIALLTCEEQHVVCWHLAQIAPRLKCTTSQTQQIITAFQQYLFHTSQIVRVAALEALAIFAERNNSILQEIIALINDKMKTGSPSVKSRGKKLLQRLIQKYPNGTP